MVSDLRCSALAGLNSANSISAHQKESKGPLGAYREICPPRQLNATFLLDTIESSILNAGNHVLSQGSKPTWFLNSASPSDTCWPPTISMQSERRSRIHRAWLNENIYLLPPCHTASSRKTHGRFQISLVILIPAYQSSGVHKCYHASWSCIAMMLK